MSSFTPAFGGSALAKKPEPAREEREFDEHDEIEDSDVFLYKKTSGTSASATIGQVAQVAQITQITQVTLFVHGWENVEPGLLSWTFPSLRSALDAVQRMRNAIAWCVVSGTGWEDLDAARASGSILVEQLA